MPSLKIDFPQLTGQVIVADHFGNLITSISELRWVADNQLELRPRFGKPDVTPITFSAGKVTIMIGDQTITGIQPMYGKAQKGELMALIDSAGHLEIAMNQGSAASQLNASSGLQVMLQIG
jgi:S-adenosylmethionine hydrolase